MSENTCLLLISLEVFREEEAPAKLFGVCHQEGALTIPGKLAPTAPSHESFLSFFDDRLLKMTQQVLPPENSGIPNTITIKNKP